MIRYSIIIPHKNRPELVTKLVESIPERSDVEILLVDDASFDDVQKKLSQLESSRSNLKVFRNDISKSKGAGWARNIGLKHSVGRFILFADSDDQFRDHAFDTLDERVAEQEKTADLYLFQVASVDEHGNHSDRNDFRTFLINKAFKLQKSDTESLTELKRVLSRIDQPWGKVFRRVFIEENEIRFDETHFSNDVMFSARTSLLATSIHVINRTLYHCLDHQKSLTREKSDKSIKERFEVSIRFNTFIDQFSGIGDFKSITGGFLWDARKTGFKRMLEMWKTSERMGVPLFYPLHRYVVYGWRRLSGADKQENRWYLISGEKPE